MPTIKVHVIDATTLNAADADGFSDPYCIIKVGTQTQRTRVEPHTLNPKWGETFTFQVNPQMDRIEVEVFDKDQIGSDDSLGKGVVQLDGLMQGQEKQVMVNLQGGDVGENVMMMAQQQLMGYVGGLLGKKKTAATQATPGKPVSNKGIVRLSITALDFSGGGGQGGWGGQQGGQQGGWGGQQQQGGWGGQQGGQQGGWGGQQQGGWGGPQGGQQGGWGGQQQGGWGGPQGGQQGGWGGQQGGYPQGGQQGGWGGQQQGGWGGQQGGYPQGGQQGGWGGQQGGYPQGGQQGGWGGQQGGYPQGGQQGGWGAPPQGGYPQGGPPGGQQGGWGVPPAGGGYPQGGQGGWGGGY